jgi:hypothetical protein
MGKNGVPLLIELSIYLLIAKEKKYVGILG